MKHLNESLKLETIDFLNFYCCPFWYITLYLLAWSEMLYTRLVIYVVVIITRIFYVGKFV